MARLRRGDEHAAPQEPAALPAHDARKPPRPQTLWERVTGSQVARLLFCVAGINASFLYWGVLQERVTTRHYGAEGDMFESVLVMQLAQAVVAGAIALPLALLRGNDLASRLTRDQLLRFFTIGLTGSVGAFLGYTALDYVSYPFQILLKSFKPVPILVTHSLLYGRRFPWHTYAGVALVTAGVALFMLLKPGSSAAGATQSLVGVGLVMLNLALDGYTNSTEDDMKAKYHLSGFEFQVFYNLAQTVLLGVFLLLPITDDLPAAIAFWARHPENMLDIALFAVCGAVGQLFIFLTVELFGTVELAVATVTRKLFSIIISVLLYGHPILLAQWACVAIVFAGITLESFGKKLLPGAEPAQARKKTQ